LPVFDHGAQRASGRQFARSTVMAMLAAFVAFGASGAHPTPAAAAGHKVVIVVGPVGSATANYIYNAKLLAAQARNYGATVYQIYSPNATWGRVRTYAQGANILIYLGHGNGYPSPYGSFSAYTKDGLGLNSKAASGNYNTKYYGEYYMRTYIHLASNAVVILNRLCYASGNNEWGMGNPTKSTAIKRIDNYGAGFLRTGAKAVFAYGISSTKAILYGLFKTNRTMSQIFWADPAAKRTYAFSFGSTRTSGMRAISDPYAASRYYRSVIGNLAMTAADWR
jgi:hypothetical protein